MKREHSPGRRVGVMGGTFDPIHLGHLACAEAVCDSLGLDEVIFVPAGRPPFKLERELASAEDRFELCTLATASNDRFSVSPIELERPGTSFTVDTMRSLRESTTEPTRFSFIIGSDAFLTVDQWKGADELRSSVEFAVVLRPGDEREAVGAFIEERGLHAEIVEAPALDISSSGIRERVARGRSIRYLVPDDVRFRIEERCLYGGNQEIGGGHE